MPVGESRSQLPPGRTPPRVEPDVRRVPGGPGGGCYFCTDHIYQTREEARATMVTVVIRGGNHGGLEARICDPCLATINLATNSPTRRFP